MLLRTAATIFFICVSALAADKPVVPTLRWSEGGPGCTFRSGQDGRVYYGLKSGDFEVTLAIDRQELAEVTHRAVPMLAVLLSFEYKGQGQFDVLQPQFVLEFVKHMHVVQSSLDPDHMLQRLQQNVDDLTDDVERHKIKPHPELKEQKEKELQARLKDYTEMMDFVSTQGLRPISLSASNPSARGWVFFGTTNRWIGAWRRPEQFVLRVPVENLIVEFPFDLPPKNGPVELRKRSTD